MIEILQNISIYSVLLPLAAGLIFWQKQDANGKIMVLLLVFAAISQLIGSKSIYQYIIYNLYGTIDILIWTILLLRNIRTRLFKIIILIAFFAFMVRSGQLFFSKGINEMFFRELVSYDLVILVVYVFMYFFEKYRSEELIILKHEPMFWFCLGIVVYAPSTFLLFASQMIFNIGFEDFKNIWRYHHIFNISLYLLITVGFLNWRIKKTSD